MEDSFFFALQYVMSVFTGFHEDTFFQEKE